MPEKGAGAKKGGKKGSNKSRGRKKVARKAKKTTESKARVAEGKIRKSDAARIPNAIGLKSQHLDFLTLRLDQVKKFYTDILGFQLFRHDSRLNYLYVQTTIGSSLGFMPPNPAMLGEPPSPKEPTIYLMVEDVDRVYTKLIAKGVGFHGPPQKMPWGHRVITTTDPEGRTVMLASEIES